MVSAMRTRSLCLRPYHMERGTVAGSRMRLCAHKRRSHARVGTWTYDYTTELSATPCLEPEYDPASTGIDNSKERTVNAKKRTANAKKRTANAKKGAKEGH